MANYKIKFSFLGNKFNGSCMQPDKITVQGSIRKAISDLFKIDTKIYMCSRLDKGVHAYEMVANFKIDIQIEPNKLINALNAKLKPDLLVSECEIVSNEFNSLFDAKGKHYTYVIYNANKHSVFLNDFAWQYDKNIDINRLKEISNVFIGSHDFASFGTNDMGTSIRKITKIEITKKDKFIYIDVFGPGFLKNMVRMVVACMVNYATNRYNKEYVIDLLINPSKGKANDLAPACGLYLRKVYY